ncbi:MAG: Nif3-like dinuclear metal center hexameric protein [Dehalococcoidia bacterium]
MSDGVPLADLVAYLDDVLEVSRYAETEPEANGITLDAGRPVSRIAAAVNTSFASIRGAAEAGAQLLIVHHTTWPSIDLGLMPEKQQALRDAGLSLYGAHASLDASPRFGNGSVLAPKLGVTVEGRFLEYCGGLAGVYGSRAGAFADFVAVANDVLGAPVESWQNRDDFGHVAIVTGAAGMTNMVEEARSLGCDTYLTGEGSMYTKLYARETKINLVFGTHYATERFGPEALAKHVAEHYGLPWSLIAEDPDIL